MKQYFLLIANLIIILPLFSMYNTRIRKWNFEGTDLMQFVEDCSGVYTDLCVQKKGGEHNEAVYSGYKLIFAQGQEAREVLLEGKDAKKEWDELETKYSEMHKNKKIEY